MLTRKIHRHDANVVMRPPSGGPITGAMSPGQTIRPIAAMIRCLGVSLRTISRPTGDMNAAATPCSARAAMSADSEEAMPHSSDANVNTATAAANTLREPNRSLTQPAAGTNIVIATR